LERAAAGIHCLGERTIEEPSMTQTTGALEGATDSVRPTNVEKVPVPSADDQETPSGQSGRARSAQGSTAELGALLLALLFGGLGFVVHFFWIPAMVIMAVVFGLLLAGRRASRVKTGLVPELIATTVHGAREIIDAASPKDDDADQTPSNHESNGHSTIVAIGTLDPVLPSNGKAGSPSADSEGDGVIEFATPHVQVQSTTGAPSDPDLLPEDVRASADLPASANPECKTSTDAVALPIRVFVSMDRLAAHNALLRPARSLFLQIAATASQTIVRLASTPPPDAESASATDERAATHKN
jgi:hypothetical protein